MPRFVIQQHDHQENATHWDLMLEVGEVLKTYRLDRSPEQLLKSAAQAEPIFDHEKRFLNYEGPVQNGLGNVRIVERGTYETITAAEDKWRFDMRGGVLQGQFELRIERTKIWTVRML